MTTNELFNEITKLYWDFADNHQLFGEKGNKAAAVRARKAIGELKKLVTQYRKVSVAESKKV